MSWVHFSDTTPKARKRHYCEVCGQDILIGETHVARSGAYDGKPRTVRMHFECEELSSRWDQQDWECHSPGDAERPVREVAS